MAANLDIIARLTDKASGPAKGIENSIAGIEGKSGFAGAAFGGLQKAGVAALTGIAVAGAAAGIAVGSVAVSSVKAASEMEVQMSNIAAVMGASKDEIEPLNSLIKDLGLDPNLKVNAVEAGQAIEMLAKNGLTMQQILDGAAHSTVLLANSTGADFATAADIGTDAMAIFNIEAENMMGAVDGIVGVTTNSKFGINDYRLALAQAGGVASAAGVEFDDFNAAITAISPLFASGSDAGTSFKTMLTRLTPASSAAEEAMAALGIITEDGNNLFYDAQGNLKSMSEVSGILQSSLSGLSEEQKAQALTTIFGADAMRAAVGLAETGAEGFAELQSVMGETDALESAATRMDNLAGVMEVIDGVIETVKLSFGQALLPVVRMVADAMLAFADGALPKIEKRLASLSSSMSGVVDTVAPVIQAFTANIQEGMSPLDAFIEAIWDIAPPRVLNALTALRDGIPTLVDWFSKAKAPIGEVAQALGGLLQNALGIGKEIVGAFQTDGFAGVADLLIEPINAISDKLGVDLLTVFQDVGTTISETWDSIVGAATTARDAVVSVLDELAREFGPTIGVLSGFGQIILQTFQEGTVKDAINKFIDLWPGIKDAIGVALAQVVSFIGEKLGVDLPGFFEKAREVVTTAWDAIVAVLGSAWAAIAPGIEPMWENLREGFASFEPLLVEFKKLWQSLVPVLKGAGAVIAAIVVGVIGVVSGLIRGIGAALGPFLTMISGVSQGIIKSFRGLIDWFVAAWDLIVGIFTGNGEQIKIALNTNERSCPANTFRACRWHCCVGNGSMANRNRVDWGAGHGGDRLLYQSL
jgi:TP901 family phage tail tape measure protein